MHLLSLSSVVLAPCSLSQALTKQIQRVTEAGPAHDLSIEASRRSKVHLVGTITYYDPENKALFFQDATGGIFVNIDKKYPLRQGDLVEVDGRTTFSYSSEIATDPTIRVLGQGTKLTAPRTTYQVLASGRKDCRLVSIRGKVRDVDIGHHPNAPSGHMDVVIPGGEVEIYFHSPAGLHQQSLLDAEVDITGVVGGSFDAKWQMTGMILYVQDASALHILRSPDRKLEQLPLTDINDLLKTQYVHDASTRVRVRGTITYFQKGYAAVIQTGAKSIYVETHQTDDLMVGDVAEAFGFVSETGYAPSLRQAIILKTGERESILAQNVSYAEALSGLHSDNLISLSGELVSELHDVGADTIVLKVDGHLVSAYFEGSAHLKDFPPGSRLRVAGICRVMPGNPWQAPYVFHLDLRDAADVVMLSKPPWWTVRHLIATLSGFAFASCALAICTMILRRRVLRQSARIQRSMKIASERTRILEMISSNQTCETVLLEICKAVMQLLPGTESSYFLSPTTKEQLEEQSECPSTSGIARNLFELHLTGPAEESIGRLMVFVVGSPQFSVADQHEVCSILKELATLAIGQSFLYQSLLHHSTHDPLTELANRRLSDRKLGEALEEAVKQAGKLAVIYIDVNRFKQVNDRYGHKVGDIYLQMISARLLLQIRLGDTLARVGGDEFLLIAPLTSHPDPVTSLTARLEACFEDPFWIEGERIEGSASFGVAIFPEHGLTAEALKRKADHTMYLAKRDTQDTTKASTEIGIYTPEELSTALRMGMFRLAYQPQFSEKGRLSGLEVLLRLEDPILGILAPDAFIAAAERSDIIIDIGVWVLRQALQDAMRWRLHEGDEICVAVNVSVRQIIQSDFADSVLTCLQEHGFPPNRLEIELIERSLLDESPEVSLQLERLHQAGVRISLDDFGTGQSSLSILHKLPIDTIKLDRSFILAMANEPKVVPIIQAITLMAVSLGKRIVAEGIEQVDSVPTLLKMAEMDFQGYLLGRPISAQEVDRQISSWRSGIEMPAAFGTAVRTAADRSSAKS